MRLNFQMASEHKYFLCITVEGSWYIFITEATETSYTFIDLYTFREKTYTYDVWNPSEVEFRPVTAQDVHTSLNTKLKDLNETAQKAAAARDAYINNLSKILIPLALT